MMPHREVADRLRKIARHLDEHTPLERRRIDELAESFDGLVSAKAPVNASERERLLSVIEDLANTFDRRGGKRFREVAIAMRELEVMLRGTISR